MSLAWFVLAQGEPARRAAELSRQGRYEEAIPAYQEAVKASPNLVPLRLNLGLAFYKTARRQEALREFDACLRLQPNNRQARHLRALVLLELDRYEQAAGAFESLLPTEDVSIHFGLATAYIRLNRTSEANKHLGPLLAREDSAEVQLLVAESYLNDNRYSLALEALERAERLNPTLPTLHFLRGAVYWKQQEPAAAIAQWRKETEIDPGSLQAAFVLGAALAIHSPGEALPHLERALALRPSHAPTLYHIGKLKWQSAQDPAAVEYLEKAAKADPEFRQAHYLLATIYRWLGQPEKAAPHLAAVRRLGEEAAKRDVDLLQVR